MTAKVFIDGESGTTGLQISQRLRGRRDIELLHLSHEERRDLNRRAEMLNTAAVSILCLPDDAAREAVSLVRNADARIIDASTAHRTADAWTYGFPEYNAGQPELIARSKRVTNPGCYACAAVSMLHPLVKAGILPPDHPVTLNAVSGYSGGGKSLISKFEADNGTETNFYLYGLELEHKHVPEVQKHGRLTKRPLFVPSVGRFAQGMIVSLPLQLWALPGSPSVAAVHDALAEHYSGSNGAKGVEVTSLQDSAAFATWLDAEALDGTDRMTLHVFGNEAREQAVVCAVLDNLGKGAAGQVVQNLELMLGLPSTPAPAPVGVYG